MFVKCSVSPDGRIDPLSKVWLDPGVQSAPHGAIRCNTAPRKTLMFWHVDADSIPPAGTIWMPRGSLSGLDQTYDGQSMDKTINKRLRAMAYTGGQTEFRAIAA